MSGKSSSFNESSADLNVSTTYSSLLFYMYCLRSKPASIIYTTFSIIRICLFLPLCICILHLGLQQWKQKRSTSSAAPMSHSDFFTYNVVIMELISSLGIILCFIGIYYGDSNIFYFGILLNFVVWYGEMYINVLTCVDRYLAVAHPITYLSHRNKKGMRIRNIICGFVWLASLIGIGLVSGYGHEAIFAFCIFTLALITVSFCSFSVLRILIRPGPGEQVQNKERIDPSKQRAFYTIVAILAVLLLMFGYGVVWVVIYFDAETNNCLILVFSFLFNIPSSLVLPLLFLHRAGKLVCCRV